MCIMALGWGKENWRVQQHPIQESKASGQTLSQLCLIEKQMASKAILRVYWNYMSILQIARINNVQDNLSETKMYSDSSTDYLIFFLITNINVSSWILALGYYLVEYWERENIKRTFPVSALSQLYDDDSPSLLLLHVFPSSVCFLFNELQIYFRFYAISI